MEKGEREFIGNTSQETKSYRHTQTSNTCYHLSILRSDVYCIICNIITSICFVIFFSNVAFFSGLDILNSRGVSTLKNLQKKSTFTSKLSKFQTSWKLEFLRHATTSCKIEHKICALMMHFFSMTIHNLPF